jgi:ADP-ribose pyrophosphatase
METIESIELAGGTRLRFLRVHVNQEPVWEWVSRTNSSEGVTIVAVTGNREIVLVRQHRIPLGGPVIELPAGLVGDADGAETPEEAVRKELQQETGYAVEPANITLLSRGPSLPGITNEVNGLWLAERVTRLDGGGGLESEGERIETLVLPLGTVVDRLRSYERDGCLIDLKVFAGLHFLQDAQRR